MAAARATTASQRTLQRCYCAVSGLSQHCFSTPIRGTGQIGSQPLRNMLETRYKTLLRRLLLRCYKRLVAALFHSVVTPSETR